MKMIWKAGLNIRHISWRIGPTDEHLGTKKSYAAYGHDMLDASTEPLLCTMRYALPSARVKGASELVLRN